MLKIGNKVIGDGNASGKIARILSDVKLDRKLIQKKITY